MRGTHGKEGEPGWHFLHGKINDDGRATLRLDGIVNNPRFAINDAQRGKKYSYRIKAQFEPGQRRRPAPDRPGVRVQVHPIAR